MSKPQIATHVSKSVTYTVYDAKWIPSSARLIFKYEIDDLDLLF